MISVLSGAIIDQLNDPEIVLSQKCIGDPEVCFDYNSDGRIVNSAKIQQAIKDYYVLALDYWGTATIIDYPGMVWHWNTQNREDFIIRSTNLLIDKWFQFELTNPFRQRSKHVWD